MKTTDDGIDPDITIGNSYVFFLYGSDQVDFCGYHINLGKRNYSLDRLKEEAYGKTMLEDYQVQDLRKLYELSEEKP